MKKSNILKVFLLTLLACCLAFALVACGGNRYRVTYDYNDGTTQSTTIEVDENSLLEEPDEPTRDGYTFAGWYNGDVEWVFETDTVTGDITLTAHWTQNEPTPPAHTHTYGDYEVTTAPTMENAGVATATCSGCAEGTEGHTTAMALPALTNENIAETATDGKYTVATTAATCTEPGSSVYTYHYDGKTLVAATVAIPAAGHTYGDYEVTTAPTAENAGVATATCSVCAEGTEGHTTTMVLPALTNENIAETATDGKYTVVTTNATCAEPGSSVYTYHYDGKTLVAATIVIPATGEHVYAYTSYAENTLLATCSVCKEDTITATLIFNGGNASATGAPFGGELVVEVDGTNFVVTIPQCTYSLTGNAFTSWSVGEKEYEIGDELVIPAEQSATLTAKWEQTNSVDTAEGFLAALADSSISSITVANDIQLTQKVTVNRNVTIDLGGNTLTYFTAEGTPKGSEAVFYFEGTSENPVTVTVRNGDIVFDVNNAAVGTMSTMFVQHATLNLTNVDVKTNKTGIFVAIATLNMTGGSVTAEGVYAIGTNASVKKEDGTALYGPAKINIKGTSGTPVTLTANGTYTSECLNDGMGICFNAGGTLSLDYVDVIGARQGVMVRNGAANISNSTITTKGACTAYGENLFWNGEWGSGSDVPMAALVIGDTAAGSYKGGAIVKLSDTQVIVADGATDDTKYIYLWADTADNTAARLIYACDDAPAAEAKIVRGNDAAEVTVEHDLGGLIVEKPATCTETGMKAHYVCADCGTYFTEDKAETTEDALIIKALGHSWGTPAYADGTVTASCTRDNCGAVLSATVSISGGDGIEGTTALTSEDFTVTNDGFTLKLPMSGFTAPDGKYFKAWQVGEVEYFPGELCDIENGATVTINAVWADFVGTQVDENVTIVRLGTIVPVSYTISVGDTVTFESELNNFETSVSAWHGVYTEIWVADGTVNSYIVRQDGAPVTNKVSGGWQYWQTEFNQSTDITLNTGYTLDAFNALKLSHKTRITISYIANHSITITYEYISKESGEVDSTQSAYSFTATINNMNAENYTINFFTEGCDAANATVTYPEIAAVGEQWASAEKTIQVGSTDVGNTPNGGWVSTLNKGEKVVLSGMQKSEGAANAQAVLLGLYSGSAPIASFRADNWINGTDTSGDVHTLVSENWSISKQTDIVWEEWLAFLKTEGGIDLTITLDWTNETQIVVMMVFSDGTTTFTQTYTITSTAESGLADSYHYCLGYENAQITIDSIVRTHA